MTRPRAAEEKPALRAADTAEVRLHHLHPRERAAFRRTITARALARYEARRAEITFTNAVLEGSTFTLPEVRTLATVTMPSRSRQRRGMSTPESWPICSPGRIPDPMWTSSRAGPVKTTDHSSAPNRRASQMKRDSTEN